MIASRRPGRVDPRAGVAALLSFLVPGFGQAYNGRWSLALVLVLPILLLVVIGAAVVAGGAAGLGHLLDLRILVALIVMDIALLGWRLVAIAQAHEDRGAFLPSAWPTWLTVGLMVVTVAMHALPAYYAAKAIDTLGTVALEGGGALFDDRAGADVDVMAPSVQPEGDERVTILLVGVDFTPGRSQHLTDTMLVATFDPATGDAAMVSVPRDLYGVRLADGRAYNAKLNSLMSTASADRATYPDGGPATLKSAIGTLLGTTIHYFAAIDMEGMRQVIDAIGGIDIVNERVIDDPKYVDTTTGVRGYYLPAGPHHLDGDGTLAFVRSRQGAGDSDFTRAARQQQALAAIADQMSGASLVLTLPALLDAVRDNMATDIPGSRIRDLADLVRRVDLGDIERVVLSPDEGYVVVDAFSAAGYVLHPNIDAIRSLGERLFGSESARTR